MTQQTTQEIEDYDDDHICPDCSGWGRLSPDDPASIAAELAIGVGLVCPTCNGAGEPVAKNYQRSGFPKDDLYA